MKLRKVLNLVGWKSFALASLLGSQSLTANDREILGPCETAGDGLHAGAVWPNL